MTLNNSVAPVVSACRIPATSVIPLTAGMARLFADGFGGISKNGNATAEQLQEVLDCQSCSTVSNCVADCIDNDDWSENADGLVFGKTQESVDLLVHVKTAAGQDKVLFVEGKLGSLINVYTGENTYPTHTKLKAKYCWSRDRINGRYPFCQTMIVLVSQDSLGQMRSRLTAYIRAGQLPPTEFMCPHDFWKRLSVSDSAGSVVCMLKHDQ